MRSFARIAVSAFVLCAYCTTGYAMSTVSGNGKYPGANLDAGAGDLMRDPKSADNAVNPYASSRGFYTFGVNRGDGVTERNRDGSGGFLNVDPFDPNSVMNNFDRYRFSNPYPYDPTYNPYGMGQSMSAPMAPYVMPGQGIPYGR